MNCADTGYAYCLEDDKIREYMKLSTLEKLEWLEEINAFTRLAQSPQAAEARELFRSS
jgi:hypothetical protein